MGLEHIVTPVGFYQSFHGVSLCLSQFARRRDDQVVLLDRRGLRGLIGLDEQINLTMILRLLSLSGYKFDLLLWFLVAD